MMRSLSDAGIVCALGGSGLLHSLGLIGEVHDWDVTTDAPLDQVERALARYNVMRLPHGDGIYASAYRLAIHGDAREIDLIGAMAIRTEGGVCRLPAIVAGSYHGIAVGSAEVWAVAYRLMGRAAKADLLAAYLRTHGARAEIVAMLLAQPLPDEVRREVASWEGREFRPE